MTIDRRTFLKGTAVAGGGLVLACHLPEALARAVAVHGPADWQPNAWLRIATDGTVTVIVSKSEMGQGIVTSSAMLVGEELDVDWAKVQTEFAPAHKDYNVSPMFPMMLTGGSTSTKSTWPTLREAGAAARAMLVAAAAKKWKAKPESLRTELGAVIHPSGKRLEYGALVTAAAKLAPPKKVVTKQPKDFKIIGTRVARLDTPAKARGTATFGIDVKVPDMLVARVVRPPMFGGKVGTLNADKAKAIAGVKDVVQITSGIAVIAEGYYPATLGVRALEITWDAGPNAKLSSADIRASMIELAAKPGVTARKDGDAAKALAGAAQTLEAVYETPYLAHATMEPLNCTAHVRTDGVEVWAPTQAQTWTQATAAAIAGVKPEQVVVHTTFLGGGFGRKAETDFIADAVEASKAVGKPVKVIWSREDDTQHDFYRPCSYNKLAAGLDKAGALVAWSHAIVGPSIMSRVFPMFVKDGLDGTATEGADGLPYAIPNIAVDYRMLETFVPVGFWRSVGASHNGFITESFLDEVAVAAKRDPFEFRRDLLAKAPRHKAVLELAAAKAGWGDKLPAGRFRGIAMVESFDTIVAEVAEVSVDAGVPRVHRVVAALDCGQVVNPNTVEAQIQSGVVFGLTAALFGEITIKNGRVVQRSFNDYPMVRMAQAPVVEVHPIASDAPPTGVGEPGVPPLAPAVCNAIFAATGVRIRKLPIGKITT